MLVLVKDSCVRRLPQGCGSGSGTVSLPALASGSDGLYQLSWDVFPSLYVLKSLYGVGIISS